MIAKLTDLNRVEYILPRIRFGAMATVAGDIVRMVGVGLKPAAEKKHGTLPAEIVQGRMPEAGNEILVGQGLITDLETEVGQKITLTFADTFQSLQGRTFEIVGIRESGVTQLDDTFFLFTSGDCSGNTVAG